MTTIFFYKMDIRDLNIDDSVIYNGCIRVVKSIKSNYVEFYMPDNHSKCDKCAKYGMVSNILPLDDNILRRIINKLNYPCTPVDGNNYCPL